MMVVAAFLSNGYLMDARAIRVVQIFYDLCQAVADAPLQKNSILGWLLAEARWISNQDWTPARVEEEWEARRA